MCTPLSFINEFVQCAGDHHKVQAHSSITQYFTQNYPDTLSPDDVSPEHGTIFHLLTIYVCSLKQTNQILDWFHEYTRSNNSPEPFQCLTLQAAFNDVVRECAIQCRSNSDKKRLLADILSLWKLWPSKTITSMFSVVAQFTYELHSALGTRMVHEHVNGLPFNDLEMDSLDILRFAFYMSRGLFELANGGLIDFLSL
ncbi:hypothetical protein ACOME3_007011 [Neoechinorhynchus agilis]